MRVPEDGQWGVQQEGGSWTGTVGTLQRRRADFSMLLNWSSLRLTVIDFSRIYASEPLVIVSTQPRPRPHYLALVAPFTGQISSLLSSTSSCFFYTSLPFQKSGKSSLPSNFYVVSF